MPCYIYTFFGQKFIPFWYLIFYLFINFELVKTIIFLIEHKYLQTFIFSILWAQKLGEILHKINKITEFTLEKNSKQFPIFCQ
jgi:hypothetical protein